MRSGSTCLLCAVDLDHADDILATDGAEVDLSSAGHAGTDMATVIEQGVLLLAVTDLTQIHFFIGYLPVADALAVTLAVLVPADILVARLALDVRALSVADTVEPVTVIRVTGRILHEAASMALA